MGNFQAGERMNEDLFTATEAAEYLGLHKQTLEKLQRVGRLQYDFKFENGERAYKQNTLDAYRLRWQSNMMTFNDIADMFGISRDAVIYHFRRKRVVSSAGRRGRAWVYGPDSVIMVARAEGWITELEEWVTGLERVGLGYIGGKGEWIVYRRGQKHVSILGKWDSKEAAQAWAASELD